jgi:16S rRNA (uracil1498-N3)-methyltransferase
MRHIRVYVSGDYPDEGQSLELPEAVRHYVATVLRARDGFLIQLFNGQGITAHARLQLEKRAARVVIEQRSEDNSKESPLLLTLAQGISRGERMDVTIQKATELGVSAIQPLFTDYCEVKLEDDDKIAKRVAHWQQVIISACEQCERSVLPQIFGPLSLTEWLAQQPQGLVLDPYEGTRLTQLGHERFTRTQAILVGPEGGLSETELNQALNAGLTGCRLGPRILRTETAGPAAIAALQTLYGDA